MMSLGWNVSTRVTLGHHILLHLQAHTWAVYTNIYDMCMTWSSPLSYYMLWLPYVNSVYCDVLPEHAKLPSSSLHRKMVQRSIKLWQLAIATLILVRSTCYHLLYSLFILFYWFLQCIYCAVCISLLPRLRLFWLFSILILHFLGILYTVI